MKKITTLIIGNQEFIITDTKDSPFAKIGKFVAFKAEDITDGATNRPLTGLDVLLSKTLDGLFKDCKRFVKHTEYMKAHPMPDYNATSPEAKADFEAWAKALALVTA